MPGALLPDSSSPVIGHWTSTSISRRVFDRASLIAAWTRCSDWSAPPTCICCSVYSIRERFGVCSDSAPRKWLDIALDRFNESTEALPQDACRGLSPGIPSVHAQSGCRASQGGIALHGRRRLLIHLSSTSLLILVRSSDLFWILRLTPRVPKIVAVAALRLLL